MPGAARDPRQFKGLMGHQMPHIFPPPPDESWEALGATPPIQIDTKYKRAASTIRAANRLTARRTMANAHALRNSDELFDLAKSHGFELIRDDGRGRLVKYGTARFTLPPQGQEANSFIAEAINNICTEIDSRDVKAKTKKADKAPLMANWQGTTYAVYAQNAGQYNLQSLVDGKRTWVPKSEVEAVTSDNIAPPTSTPNGASAPHTPEPVDTEAIAREVNRAAEAAFPRLSVITPPPPAPSTGSFMDDMADASPMAYARTMIARQVERARAKLQAEELKLQPLRAEVEALEASLAALTGIAPAAPRRTVLPPTGPGRRASAGVTRTFATDAQKREAKRLWETTALTVSEIAEKIGYTGTSTNVYAWRNADAGGKWGERPSFARTGHR